jgi:hypothetical protein
MMSALIWQICEELCPNYYNKSMLGTQVEVAVLDTLVKERLPRVSALLQRVVSACSPRQTHPLPPFPPKGIDLMFVATSWLVCLYCDILPTEVYRVIYLLLTRQRQPFASGIFCFQKGLSETSFAFVSH